MQVYLFVSCGFLCYKRNSNLTYLIKMILISWVRSYSYDRCFWTSGIYPESNIFIWRATSLEVLEPSNQPGSFYAFRYLLMSCLWFFRNSNSTVVFDIYLNKSRICDRIETESQKTPSISYRQAGIMFLYWIIMTCNIPVFKIPLLCRSVDLAFRRLSSFLSKHQTSSTLVWDGMYCSTYPSSHFQIIIFRRIYPTHNPKVDEKPRVAPSTQISASSSYKRSSKTCRKRWPSRTRRSLVKLSPFL